MAMTKRMLADVLWEAANERLLNRRSSWEEPTLEYSCNAAIAAERGPKFERPDIRGYHQGKVSCRAADFLAELGCDPGSANGFHGVPTHLVQGARYMWLLLAMHVAEDEGIEVSATGSAA